MRCCCNERLRRVWFGSTTNTTTTRSGTTRGTTSGRTSRASEPRTTRAAFEIQLVEIEDLRLTGLSIAGVEFPAPYRYTEEFRGVGLEIVARIKVNVDELDQLYELSITDPHEVVRHGVTEESRLMSLLVTAWSPAPDETATCEVWLGDPRDVDSDWALVAKSVGMGRDALAGVDALLAALQQRGVLPAEAMDAIQEDVERRRRDLHFHMFEVHDLETDVQWRGR